MKLTAANVRTLALPSGKSEAIIFDDDVPGFGVRIRQAGSRTFVFQYKLGSKQRRIALGSVKALDIGKARDTAKDLYAAVRLGRDPAGEKALAKVSAVDTLGAAVGLFLGRQRERLRRRSFVENRRHLLVHAKPLHGFQLGKVDRRSVATLLSRLESDSGPVAANRVRASLSALYAWAIREGMADSNPVTGTNRREERSRDRVLAPHELKLIWNALEPDHYGSILKLLMLTAQRRDEIAGLHWSEIDFEAAAIILLRERVKNDRQHTTPLSAPALAILQAHPRQAGRELVFGHANGPWCGWAYSKKALDSRIAEQADRPLLPWVLHDLRRSAATHMADKLGIQPHHIEAVLNHASGHKSGIAGVYNRSSYETEKRAAVNLWADYLLAIIEGRAAVVVEAGLSAMERTREILHRVPIRAAS